MARTSQEHQCSECGCTLTVEVEDGVIVAASPFNGPALQRAFDATELARDEYRAQAEAWEKLYLGAQAQLDALSPHKESEQSDASSSSQP